MPDRKVAIAKTRKGQRQESIKRDVREYKDYTKNVKKTGSVRKDSQKSYQSTSADKDPIGPGQRFPQSGAYGTPKNAIITSK